jgi:AcrR family transcriptional regulator
MARKSTGKSPGRPKEFCEQQALMKAVQVFAEKGFENTSLTDLTSAMGINRFSMYSTFGNKEELYVKAMQTYSDARKELLVSLLAAKTARAGIERMLRGVAARFASPEGHGVCFITHSPLTSTEVSAGTRHLFAQRRTEVEQVIEQRLQDAVLQGELPSHTLVADEARYYAIIIQGFALQAQHGGTLEELNRVIDVIMTRWKKVPNPETAY